MDGGRGLKLTVTALRCFDTCLTLRLVIHVKPLLRHLLYSFMRFSRKIDHWSYVFLISLILCSSLVHARDELSILTLTSRATPHEHRRIKRGLNASEPLLDYFSGTDLQ